jgi:hypothetical protein
VIRKSKRRSSGTEREESAATEMGINTVLELAEEDGESQQRTIDVTSSRPLHRATRRWAVREVDGAPVLFMAHLKVRPTKIRVKSAPPFKNRRVGHP